MDDAGGDVVGCVVADRLQFPSQSQSALHGFEEFAHDAAVGGDLHLYGSAIVHVDDGECLPRFVEDVLGDVEGALVAFGAEAASLAVDFVWACTGGAVRGVPGEGFHHVEFVVVGKA